MYTQQQIWYKDNGLFTLGSDELRGLVSFALTSVPEDVVDELMDHCLMAIALAEDRGIFM